MSPSQPNHWSDWFRPEGSVLTVEEQKKHKQLTFVCFLTAGAAAVNLVASIPAEFPVGIYVMAVALVIFIALPFWLRRGVNANVVAHTYVGMIFVANVILTASSGGLSKSMTSPYIAIVPILGLMLVGKRAGLFWLGAALLQVLVLGSLQIGGVEFAPAFDEDVDQAFKLSAYFGLVAVVFLIVQNFDAIAEGAFSQVRSEQEETERLLLNILPAQVAQELKESGEAVAREFDEVTILFSDFRDFTAISSTMTPKALVAELNACFSQFDAITEYYNLEKIKTIGDAYMAAGGLPHVIGSSPADAVHAALDMQTFLDRRYRQNQALGKPAFTMRVGLHTGPVVAGIVGVTKFQYDIWGDAVNTAARMESSGQVGRVNISEATYELVKDVAGLVLTPRGKIEAKGKGELPMFFADLPRSVQKPLA